MTDPAAPPPEANRGQADRPQTEWLQTDRIVATRTTHRGWFDVRVVTMAGPDGARFDRGVVDHPVGAALLAYDPARRVAMLITQPRAPLLHAGEPAMLETISGRVDDESPEACIRREVLEEAGLRLGVVEPVATVWSTPASSTEHCTLFLAPYAAADRIAPGGGLADEQERITLHETDLTTLATLADTGGIRDAKLFTLILALRLRHPDLFRTG